MRLILFRHGPAEPRDAERWPDDLARPLTPRGAQRTRRAASGLARLEPRIAKVFTSPALRCVESARCLAAELHGAGLEVIAALAPGADPRALLRAVAREGKEAVVALVGHEPDLAELAAALLGMSPRALAFKKAGACSLDWSGPGPGGTSLRWWLGPGVLRAIRQRRKGGVA
jgi:phosphohistidine phosphatase